MKKYEIVIRDIKSKIENNIYQVNERLPTEFKMIDYYKVSRITIQKALSILENEKLVTRIQGKGTFVADNNFQHNKKKFISLVFVNNVNVLMEIIDGAQVILEQNGYSITVNMTNSNINNEKEICEKAINDGASGIIIFPIDDNSNRDFFTKLVLQGYSIVFVDKKPCDTNCNFVTSNNFESMFILTEYLLKIGHKKIAILTCTGYYTVLQRIEGIKYACKINDRLDTLSIYTLDDNFNDIQEKLSNIMTNEPPDVFICTNDNIAVNCILTLHNLGYNIPKDVSVTGYDNIYYLSNNYYNLTTVDQNFKTMGSTAAKLLINHLVNNVKELTSVFIKGNLIKKDSSKYKQ